MLKIKKKMAQSTLEYAILIVVIAGAFLTTQMWLKHAVQGKIRSSADDIGEQFSTAFSNADLNFDSYSKTNETVVSKITKSTLLDDATSNKIDSINLSHNQEYWGPTSTP
ncbi:MAG: hypothetical protein Q8O13_11205 [Candidatus Omnitrophota bacterium]|nr:hypothetical protein [Candidatus Omnitrophota bacterium]